MYLLPQRSKGKALFGIAALLAIVFPMLTGCSPTPGHISQAYTPELLPTNGAAHATVPSETLSVEKRLKAMVMDWAGTPHRLGGIGRDGIDCSGFVQRVYRDLFGIGLPRSTATQVQLGVPVSKQDLRAADLVFFKPPHKVRHVGIYLGHGQFAHASSSRGITVSNLDSPYWRHAFWAAKRVLPRAKK